MSVALSPFTLRLILSGVLLASAIGLGLCGRRLGLNRWFEAIAVALLVGAALWLPAIYRTPVCSGLAALIFWLGAGPIVGIAVGAIVFGVAALAMPGGGTVLVLVILFGVAAGVVGLSIQRLRRIGRARRLQPGTPAEGELELGGLALGIKPVSPPGVDLSCLLYRASPWGERVVASREPFAIRAPEGIALCEPDGAELDLGAKKRTLSVAEARGLLGLADNQPTPKGGGGPSELAYLEEGSPCYLVGVPVWAWGSWGVLWLGVALLQALKIV